MAKKKSLKSNSPKAPASIKKSARPKGSDVKGVSKKVSSTKKKKTAKRKRILGDPDKIISELQFVNGHYWYETSCCETAANEPHLGLFVSTVEYTPQACGSNPPTVPNNEIVEIEADRARSHGTVVKEKFRGYFPAREKSKGDSEIRQQVATNYVVRVAGFKNGVNPGNLMRKRFRLVDLRGEGNYIVADRCNDPNLPEPTHKAFIMARKRSKKRGADRDERLHLVHMTLEDAAGNFIEFNPVYVLGT